MATKSNWQKFDSAFSQVSSYIVLDKETKQVIAKIALKYPKDGAGRLTCYMSIIGNELQVGTASGYGYDKPTTAIINASRNQFGNVSTVQDSFLTWLSSNTAQSGWQEVINENNGFIVIQAI